MSRRLRMTAELGDWLTELGEIEPATAAEVGAALVAVLDAAEPSGLAIISKVTTAYPRDPRETADLLYQRMLEELQHVRRIVSEVATARKRADLRLNAERAASADAGRLADLEHDLAALHPYEEQLTEQSQRLHWQVDAFRSAKETAKALYTAAEAQLRIAGALATEEGGTSDAELATWTTALRAAQESMERVTSRGKETLLWVREQAGHVENEFRVSAAGKQSRSRQPHAPLAPPQPQPRPLAPEPAPGLLELRADLLGSDIRFLLAVEPADTVTLLAVLEGPDAVSEHGAEAVRLASDLLTDIRADSWPAADVDEVALADAEAFLARFFPADDGSIRQRAAVLADHGSPW